MQKPRKLPRDPNSRAAQIVALSTGQAIPSLLPKEPDPNPPEESKGGKNPAAVALGRLGGLKGGKARAMKLTPERRMEIAKVAAASRWKRNAS